MKVIFPQIKSMVVQLLLVKHLRSVVLRQTKTVINMLFILSLQKTLQNI